MVALWGLSFHLVLPVFVNVWVHVSLFCGVFGVQLGVEFPALDPSLGLLGDLWGLWWCNLGVHVASFGAFGGATLGLMLPCMVRPWGSCCLL